MTAMVIMAIVAGSAWAAVPKSQRDAAHLPLNVGADLTLALTDKPPVAPKPERDAAHLPLNATKTPGTPDHIELSPLVSRLIADPVITDKEQLSLELFHGQWDKLPAVDQLPLDQQAKLALLRYELNAPVLRDKNAPALLRAKGAMRRGEPKQVLAILKGDDSAQGAWLEGRALEQLGRYREAIRTYEPWGDRLAKHAFTDAAELTAAARIVARWARLTGQSAAYYQVAMDALAKVRQQLDPLYWPADLAEATLLIDKDNRPQGAKAILDALALNPKAGGAWYQLGLLAVDGYAFDQAALAFQKLRAINPDHPLADLLETRSLLQQRDVAGAMAIIDKARATYPTHRRWLALDAAAHALSFATTGTKAALDRFDELAPNNPLAYDLVGKVLSSARQYDLAAAALREAIRRQPNWADPHIELGLLLMQKGDLPAARDALVRADRIDPFNRQAHNQLWLVNELLGYKTIKTDHFLIRYKPGIDEVLARDMPGPLEQIYDDITTAFEHKPRHITQIDIMPDERYFGVRITGLPEIWTIAASTGDVISLTPPRSGAHQRGTYNWVNVIRHEFVHVVTLDQTNNRVPHWFTEACAVSQETTGRQYQTCQLLAAALHKGNVFPLNEINWGFIRPKTPLDRPLAYGQAEWMLEYLNKTYGHQSIIDLLNLYRVGTSDAAAMTKVTGKAPKQFMEEFKAWASGQVRQWGLAPTNPALAEVLKDAKDMKPEVLESLLQKYPNEPDLLKLVAQRAVDAVASRGPTARRSQPQTDQRAVSPQLKVISTRLKAARQAVSRYAEARPVDPWSQKARVTLAAAAGDLTQAIPALRKLDQRSESDSRWAYELAKLDRAADRLDDAAQMMQHAIHAEPYNAGYRQLAATIDLQRHKPEPALYQLQALAMLEPDRAIHQVRLAALYHMLGRDDEARAAAKKALALDPHAQVQQFLR